MIKTGGFQVIKFIRPLDPGSIMWPSALGDLLSYSANNHSISANLKQFV